MYYNNELEIFYVHNNKPSATANHIYIRFCVVKDGIQEHTLHLCIRLQKAYQPMPAENPKPTQVYGKAYDSRICFKIDMCVNALNLMVVNSMTGNVLYGMG